MPTTYEFAIASDVLEGPEGATYVGITPIAGLEHIPGLTAEQVQDALVAIKILLDAKLSGIQDNDVDVTFRSKINFTGAGFTITDDATNGVTEFHIPSLADYPHVESVLDEGVDRGVHRKIDFQGTGVTVVEDTINDKYVVTVPGTYIQRLTNEADDLGDQPELRIMGTGVSIVENTVDGRYEVTIDAYVPPPIVERVTNEADTLGEQPELRIISEWATLIENTVDGRYELEIPTPEPIPIIPPPPVEATEFITGLTRLSLPAVIPGTPIAVGDNDPRNSDERVPEDGSVTLPKAQDDVIFFYRCTSTTRPTLPKLGQMIFETDTHSCQKNVSADPTIPDWVAVGSLADIPIADDGEANSEELVRADDSRLSNSRPPEDGSIELPAASPEISLVYICTSTTRPTLPKRGQIIYEEDTGIVMKNLGVPATPNWQPVGTGAANITFQEEGDTIAQRATLDVQGEGATVLDDATNLKTILTIPGMNVQDEGVNVTPRKQVNFIGMDVSDDSANNRVNVTPPGGAAKASDTVTGITKLSVAAADAADPIAAGTNDPRVPSQGENDALVGTNGTPGSANKYVTDSDTRNTNTRTPTDGTVTDAKVAVGAAIAESKLSLASDAAAGTASRRTLGTSSTSAAAGNDARFTNPTATVFEDFLGGLGMVVAAPGTNHNNVSIAPGACWIPGSGKIVNNPSTITPPSSTTLSFNTWYFLYGYNNGGVLALDPLSTTPPSAPYKGTARTQSGDTSRRYLGSVKTSASSVLYRTQSKGDWVMYYEPGSINAPFAVLVGGATTSTPISCSAVVPITSTYAHCAIYNTTAGVYAYFSNSDIGTLVSTAFWQSMTGNTYAGLPLLLNSSQAFTYIMSTAGGNVIVVVLGYLEER